jgi:hypothetical protein
MFDLHWFLSLCLRKQNLRLPLLQRQIFETAIYVNVKHRGTG